MNDISSKYTGSISSKTDGLNVESKKALDVQSKTDFKLQSAYQQERDAFLYTSKRNASAMFAKYL